MKDTYYHLILFGCGLFTGITSYFSIDKIGVFLFPLVGTFIFSILILNERDLKTKCQVDGLGVKHG